MTLLATKPRNFAAELLAPLFDILSYKRPAFSKVEQAIVDKHVAPCGAEPDAFGNMILRIPMPDGSQSRVLWSCHTDTIHYDEGRQRLELGDGYLTLASDETGSNCLGADCGAGMFVMLEMAKARVPGLYVFHRAEEEGGKGSAHIASKSPDLLGGIQAVIAFDRRGDSSVITHQYAGRTCSDMFGRSLAAQLPGRYVLDDTGSFTDSANYADIVPECSNISVGYYKEHSSKETLDLRHVLNLRRAMLAFDESKLLIDRNPSTDEGSDWRGTADDNAEFQTILDFVTYYPEQVATLLSRLGYDARELERDLFDCDHI
jgi:hypothetical protein